MTAPTDTSRPTDRWDYSGDCEHCFAGEPHTLDAHDAALGVFRAGEADRHLAERIAAIAFQAGITDEEAARFVEES